MESTTISVTSNTEKPQNFFNVLFMTEAPPESQYIRKQTPKRLCGGQISRTHFSAQKRNKKKCFGVLDLVNSELSKHFDDKDTGLVVDMEKLPLWLSGRCLVFYVGDPTQ